jgi:hypothetical protein
MSVELDELVALATGSDQQILKDILGRNPNLATRAETSSSLFKAFVDGDDASVDASINAAKVKAAADAAAARRTNQSASNSTSNLAIDMAELEQLADKRAEEKFRAMTTSPEYVAAEEERVEKIAKKIAVTLSEEVLGKAAKTSDEIYQIRRSHEKEFGNELDTTKLVEFMNAPENAGKFTSLAKCHDAFVQDDRLKNEIAKGVAAGLKVEEDKKIEVPGQSLGTSTSILGSMMRANKTMTEGESARGPALDAAARAFRSLRAQNAE